jgi:hypothetical protein
MISGNHSHLCDVCHEEYQCLQFTHCRRDEADGPAAFCAFHDESDLATTVLTP